MNGFTSGRLEKGKTLLVSRKLRRAAVSWLRWKVPQWAGALAARQSTRTPRGAGSHAHRLGTRPRATVGTSHVDIHNRMFALTSFMDTLNMI